MLRAARPTLLVLLLVALSGCALYRRIFPPATSTTTPTTSASTSKPAETSTIDAPPVARTTGALLLAGGGRVTGAAIGEVARLAGGTDARIVVVPLGMPAPDAGRLALETWHKAGFQSVELLDSADDARAVAQIRGATFVWMIGGDAARLIDELGHHGLVDEIRARYEAGALVGGTNAGAAVLSELALTGSEDESALEQGRVKTVGGLGLLRGVIVDERFVAKKRFNRLTAAVLDHPQFVGVGIDESTAIIVVGTTLRVVGDGNAVILDARRAQVRATRAGDASGATGVEMAVLSGGMTFDLAAR